MSTNLKNFEKIPKIKQPLIETHCHLDYAKSYEINEILELCSSLNIEKIITISVCPENLDKVLKLSEDYEQIYCSQGIHPHDAKTSSLEIIEKIKKSSMNKKVVAIGEIGLDYHYNLSEKKTQLEVFEQQLDLASQRDMPVIIHSRDADEDMIKLLASYAPKLKRKGVIHSFSSSMNLAQKAIDLGFYLGFNGIITFKNASEVREALEFAPINRILIETDSPYLTPTPFRGRENFPFYLPLVVDMISKVKTLKLEEVAEITTQNAKDLFRF